MVKIGVSARHVHLCKSDLDELYGKDYSLTKKCNLSQKGQYACNEKLTLKGPKSIVENVRILGPLRCETQVELSRTDAFKLGVNPPVRVSGDLNGASLIEIIGPNGSIKRNCAIISARHIHLNEEDAKLLNVENVDRISIKISGIKPGIMDNVYVRINKNFIKEIHIDTDEANAFMINNGDEAELIYSAKEE